MTARSSAPKRSTSWRTTTRHKSINRPNSPCDTLDDFGTGYSSLTYLKRLPALHLKIERSFVRDMLDHPDDLAILEGVLGLATAFQLKSIAEGVESIDHGTMLLQLGCELAQGDLIARPMPADRLQDWYENWVPPLAWMDQRPVPRDQLPVLSAAVSHRAWIREVSKFLEGKRDQPPEPPAKGAKNSAGG